MSDDKQQFSILPRLLNGGIAGLVGVCAVFPIDLVKTRLQNQEIGPHGERMYRGMWDCFKKTYAQEKGLLGFYRVSAWMCLHKWILWHTLGAGVNLLLIVPEKVIKLVGNDWFRNKLKDTDGHVSLLRGSLAGALAGTCQIIVTIPMELLKIQQQDQGRTALKAGPDGKTATKITATESALKLVREKGIAGLYRGAGATALRDVPFSATYFPLYAYLRQKGAELEGKEKASPYIDLFAGIAAGGFAALFVNPCDVVKTRLQTINRSADEKVYKGVVDCFRQVYQTEGIRAFYKGGACRMAVIAPLFGIAQLFYFLGIGEMILGHPRPQY